MEGSRALQRQCRLKKRGLLEGLALARLGGVTTKRKRGLENKRGGGGATPIFFPSFSGRFHLHFFFRRFARQSSLPCARSGTKPVSFLFLPPPIDELRRFLAPDSVGERVAGREEAAASAHFFLSPAPELIRSFFFSSIQRISRALSLLLSPSAGAFLPA